jgi:calcineurin-like phosphoesterase family protein
LGNHDKPLRQAYKRGLLDELIESGRLTLVGDTDPRIQTALRVSIEGQGIVLAHFAQRSWHGAFRGGWHLYGHSHGNLSPFHKSMDVGVDANDFRPFSFADIQSRMEEVPESFSET